jgi:hypothetical protein
MTRISQVEANANSEIIEIKKQLSEIFYELKSLNDSKSKHEDRIKKNEEAFVKINDELFNTQLQFEEKHSVHENIFKEVNDKIT